MALGMHLYRYLRRHVATGAGGAKHVSRKHRRGNSARENHGARIVARGDRGNDCGMVFGAVVAAPRSGGVSFDDTADFQTVCESAGMDAAHLRSRLKRLRTAKLGYPLSGEGIS